MLESSKSREGEEVVIGDPTNPVGIVRVASVKGDRVRLAMDFPRDVEVHRREVADREHHATVVADNLTRREQTVEGVAGGRSSRRRSRCREERRAARGQRYEAQRGAPHTHLKCRLRCAPLDGAAGSPATR